MKPGTLWVREGDRFGSLTVLEDRLPGMKTIRCVCDCGTETTPKVTNLKRTKSCGCWNRGVGNPRWNGAPHNHPLYTTWKGMNERCSNSNHRRYSDYGGRGISVCERWSSDFWVFVEDMGERPEGHSLDRIDNDGNYEPGNVRWATASDQNLNQRKRPPKPRCKNNHEFTPDNTRVNADGSRACKACDRERAQAYRAKATLV